MSTTLFDDSALTIISTYTRAEAIKDGVLVDMTQDPFGPLAVEAGIRWPIAMTSAAFHEFVEVSDSKGHQGQDLKGRWWDVLWMFKIRRREVSPIEALCSVYVQDPDGRTREKQIKCVSGPADDETPCLTFMLPDED